MSSSLPSTFVAAVGLATVAAAELAYTPVEAPAQIQIKSSGQVRLASPPEGLWSISSGMLDGWPQEAHHAQISGPARVSGPWTIFEGTLEMNGGSWKLRDSYRALNQELFQCIRRWEWHGEKPTGPVTLSVRWLAPTADTRELLPGILYHRNPSGADSGRVPVLDGTPGELGFFEEHRFPVPFASLEWDLEKQSDGVATAALHTVPSPVPHAGRDDLWWSLGLRRHEAATEFALLSGPCAMNGKPGWIKAAQSHLLPYPDTHIDVPPGGIIEKTFFLQVGKAAREGDGFRLPLRTALAASESDSDAGLPSFADILDAKWRYARTRWFEKDDVAGFRMFPDRNTITMGWCGQAASPAYALLVLGPDLAPDDWRDRTQRSLDTLTRAEFHPKGFHVRFEPDTGKWDRGEPLSEGQGLFNFTRAIRLGREQKLDTAKWEEFVRKACTVHAERILADDWRPKSTNEGFLVAPLADAGKMFDERLFRRAAIKAADHYLERHRSMKEPYWGGTLDARCEDKEGAFAGLQAFLAAHRLVGEEKYLDAARHAADVCLTYLVTWNIDLPPGRLRDHGFKTRGWTAVSVQNMHIDAYGVLIAPDIYRLGKLTDDPLLQRTALLMFRSCGQLIDPLGSHGEQPQHTNYAQHGKVDKVEGLRGGYVETWTVFWLTAHFLNAAADLAEQGVELW